MKEFKRILILPFAITAMLFLGALTTSASNVSDVEVAPVEYFGNIYVADPVIPNTFHLVGSTDGGCYIEASGDSCTLEEEGMTQIYGEDPNNPGVYIALRKL
ncbi:hypothetical protein [Myroides sp. LJL110]